MNAPRDIPAFLEQKEQPALYAWWSNGRLQICKHDEQVDLSLDDLSALRRFLGQFEQGDAP